MSCEDTINRFLGTKEKKIFFLSFFLKFVRRISRLFPIVWRVGEQSEIYCSLVSDRHSSLNEPASSTAESVGCSCRSMATRVPRQRDVAQRPFSTWCRQGDGRYDSNCPTALVTRLSVQLIATGRLVSRTTFRVRINAEGVTRKAGRVWWAGTASLSISRCVPHR